MIRNRNPKHKKFQGLAKMGLHISKHILKGGIKGATIVVYHHVPPLQFEECKEVY